ncbi:hypothetical protein ACOSP6_15275 [Tenacibaculum sp. MEBiC06402]|uniref:hypothetical protein n=1 Tax=unclassified Tenacibaculum TaxID=2635139 RepID=UPI003B9B9871
MNRVTKIGLFLGFVLTGILYLYMLATVTSDNNALRNSLKPIPIIFLLMLYSFESKIKSPLIISTFLLIVIADIVSAALNMFWLALIIYGLGNLLLVRMMLQTISKRAKKELLIYFLLSVILFLIVFVYVIQDKGNCYFSILFYGLTVSLLFSVSLLNYKHEMILANGLLFLTIGVRVISDAVYAVVIFNISNVYFDLISLSIWMISCFLFYKSFLLREKHLSS